MNQNGQKYTEQETKRSTIPSVSLAESPEILCLTFTPSGKPVMNIFVPVMVLTLYNFFTTIVRLQ